MIFLSLRFNDFLRMLLATPHLLRCCVWAPIRDLGGRLFGRGGGQLLEEVLAGPPRNDPPARGARVGGLPQAVRAIRRYGPPPSSLPVPVFAASHGRPSTSRHARSLLEGRLVDRPDVDGQALQLALGELSQAMRRAEVITLFKLVFSYLPVLNSLGGCSAVHWKFLIEVTLEGGN